MLIFSFYNQNTTYLSAVCKPSQYKVLSKVYIAYTTFVVKTNIIRFMSLTQGVYERPKPLSQVSQSYVLIYIYIYICVCVQAHMCNICKMYIVHVQYTHTYICIYMHIYIHLNIYVNVIRSLLSAVTKSFTKFFINKQ